MDERVEAINIFNARRGHRIAVEPDLEKLREALKLLSPKEAGWEQGRGVLIGMANTMQAFGLKLRDALEIIFPLVPPDFRIKSFPDEWLRLEEGDLRSTDFSEVVSFQDLLASVPEKDRDAVMDKLLDKYLYIVGAMISYSRRGKRPKLYMSRFQDHDPQWIAYFTVNDLEKPLADKWNLHGHNVSQCLFNGGLLLQDGELSIHT